MAVTIGCCVTRTHPPKYAKSDTEDINKGRIEAMLSVHAHFLWPDKRFPPRVYPISLENAATFLRDDTDRGRNRPAWSRRRRAIGEIAAVGLNRGEFRRALKILGVDPDDIALELRKRAAVEQLSAEQLSAEQLATLISDLPQVAGAREDCFSNWSKLQVTVAPANASHAAYTVKIHVPNSAGEVAKAIDPQSWDHCSKFFCPPERTYLAHLSNTNQTIGDPRLTPWTVYKGRTLYEHFTCPLTDCANTTFETLLNVSAYELNFTGLPMRYQVTYDLNTYLSGYADGFSKDGLQILIDGGELWAESDPVQGGTTAYADKTLLFRSDILTGAVNGAFRVAQEELAREFAEMACCAITNSIPTACPP